MYCSNLMFYFYSQSEIQFFEIPTLVAPHLFEGSITSTNYLFIILLLLFDIDVKILTRFFLVFQQLPLTIIIHI